LNLAKAFQKSLFAFERVSAAGQIRLYSAAGLKQAAKTELTLGARLSEVLNTDVDSQEENGFSRRRVIAGVAWSLPVIATAIAAPAAAASGISATAALTGPGSSITFVSSSGTGTGTNHNGTGPTGFQITNSGTTFTGAVSGTVNITPTGTVAAGAGVQSIQAGSSALTLTGASYSSTHVYNATFSYGGGITGGQTLNFPMSFQYERISGSQPSKVTYNYTLTITLTLPDGTSRTLTGALTVSY